MEGYIPGKVIEFLGGCRGVQDCQRYSFNVRAGEDIKGARAFLNGLSEGVKFYYEDIAKVNNGIDKFLAEPLIYTLNRGNINPDYIALFNERALVVGCSDDSFKDSSIEGFLKSGLCIPCRGSESECIGARLLSESVHDGDFIHVEDSVLYTGLSVNLGHVD